MTPKQVILDYILFTSFVWGMFLVWLIPFQLFVVGMEWDMFVRWITFGTVADMIASYPIGKIIIRCGPRITNWVKTK